MTRLAHVVTAAGLLIVPILFDLGCAEPVAGPKLALWLLAAALAMAVAAPSPPAGRAYLCLRLWSLWLVLSALVCSSYEGWFWVATVVAAVVCVPWMRVLPYSQSLAYALGGWGLTALYSWVQRLGLDPFPWSSPALSRELTIAGLGNPNYLGMYLAALLPLVWCWAYPRGPLAWLGVVVGWTALILCATRGSILAAGVVLVAATVLAAWRGRLRSTFWLWTWLLFALGLAVGGLAAQRTGSKPTSLPTQVRELARGDSSVSSRALLWSTAARVAWQHPVFGVGPGRFGVHYLHSRPLEPPAQRVLQRLPEDPHNEPLRVWVESGLVGLVLWLGWAGWLLATLPRQNGPAGAGLAVLFLNGMTNGWPLAVWPLLAWFTGLACSTSRSRPARVRWWAVPFALAVAALAWGTWISQRAFWWDDEYAFGVGPGSSRAALEESATRRRRLLLDLGGVCPPYYRPERARRLSLAMLALERSGSKNVSTADAEEWARRRLAMDPENPYAWQALTMVYEEGGRWEEAEAAWRQANRYDPRNPAVLLFWARALARVGKGEEALARTQESLEINSNSAQVYQIRAQIRIERGQSWEGYWDWVRGCQYR